MSRNSNSGGNPGTGNTATANPVNQNVLDAQRAYDDMMNTPQPSAPKPPDTPSGGTPAPTGGGSSGGGSGGSSSSGGSSGSGYNRSSGSSAGGSSGSTSGGATGGRSGAYTRTTVVTSVRVASRTGAANSAVEAKMNRHARKAGHTVKGIATSAARSAMNETETGQGLSKAYDNGLELFVKNKGATVKLVMSSACVAKPFYTLPLAVVGITKKSLSVAALNTFRNKYAAEEARNALAKMNSVLMKHGYKPLTQINRAEIKDMISDIKDNVTDKSVRNELVKALREGRDWEAGLDFQIGRTAINGELGKNGIKVPSGLKGGEYSRFLREQQRQLRNAGLLTESLQKTLQKGIDLGDAERFKLMAKKKGKKRTKIIKNIMGEFGRLLRQTDTGRGLSMALGMGKAVVTILSSVLHAILSVGKLIGKLNAQRRLASLQRLQKRLQTSNQIVGNLKNPLNPSKWIQKEMHRNTKLQGKLDRLNKRMGKAQARSNKFNRFMDKLKDPFGLKRKARQMVNKAMEKALRKILGDRLYELLGNAIKAIMRVISDVISKIVSLFWQVILVTIIVIIIIVIIVSILALFDLSGATNYQRLREYVVELYKDDIRYMASSDTFTEESTGDEVTGLNCTNIIFDNSTYIDSEKYDERIKNETNKEFDHLASSNIAEIMCMTYIHCQMEIGDGEMSPSETFNDAKYKDLKDYVTRLWRGSHHFKVTKSGDKVVSIVYSTYYFDDIFDCTMRSDRWVDVVQTTGDTSCMSYQIWRTLTDDLGYSDYAAAVIIGDMEANSISNPCWLEWADEERYTEEEIIETTNTMGLLGQYTLDHLPVNGNEKRHEKYKHYLARGGDTDDTSDNYYACGVGLFKWTGEHAWNLLYKYNPDTNTLDDIEINGETKANEDWYTTEYQLYYLDYTITSGCYGNLDSSFKTTVPADEDDEEEVREVMEQLIEDYCNAFSDRDDDAVETQALEIYYRYENIGNSTYVAFGQNNGKPENRYKIYNDDTVYTYNKTWTNKSYCGCCAIASVIASMLGEPTIITPRDVYDMNGGSVYMPYDCGSMTQQYGITQDKMTRSYDYQSLDEWNQDIINRLEQGGCVVMHCDNSGGSAKFMDGTSIVYNTQHFIAILAVIDKEENIVLVSSSGKNSFFKELDLDDVPDRNRNHTKFFIYQ